MTYTNTWYAYNLLGIHRAPSGELSLMRVAVYDTPVPIPAQDFQASDVPYYTCLTTGRP